MPSERFVEKLSRAGVVADGEPHHGGEPRADVTADAVLLDFAGQPLGVRGRAHAHVRQRGVGATSLCRSRAGETGATSAGAAFTRRAAATN